MNYIEKFLNLSKTTLDDIYYSQKQTLADTAARLSTLIAQGGIIYIFGCGHSHIFAEDVFYRAGELAPVRPILIEPLMLHQGAARSSVLEKQNHFVAPYLTDYPITAKDALIVISSSGINPVPIDVALWGQRNHALTIAITSFVYATTLKSKHHSARFLRDVVDIAIDNKVPLGDAVMQLEHQNLAFAPISSVAGVFLMHAIFAQVIANLAKNAMPVPVFLSGNIPDSEQHNNALLDHYRSIIPELTRNL